MNKQELIKKYKELWNEHSPFHEPVPYTSMIELFLKELKQLDEPKPVKIPQFVADWMSNLKSGLFGLNYDSVSSEVYDWVYAAEDNLRKLHLAFVYGYEVEKEKRYLVKIKNVYHGDLGHAAPFEQFSFYTRERNRSGVRYEFTRKQLEEAGLGWVFDCPGIEIEEVE